MMPFKQLWAWHKRRAEIATANRMTAAAAGAASIHNSELFYETDGGATIDDFEPRFATPPSASSEEPPKSSNIEGAYIANFPWLLPSPDKLTGGLQTKLTDAEIERKSAEVVALFANLELKVEVANVVQGARFSTYEIKSRTRKQILKTPELKAAVDALQYSTALVVRGDMVAGVLIENDNFTHFTLRDMLRTDAYRTANAKLPFAVGMTAHSASPIVDDLATLNSTLIVGHSKAERTHFLNSVLAAVLLNCTPNDARLLVFGPRDGISARYAKLPHLYAPPATGDNEVALVLDGLMAEMQLRISAQDGVGGEFVPALNYPRIFVAFEDLDAALPMLNQQSIANLARLAKWGHRTGIQLIATAHSAAETKIPLNLNAELQSRICFKVADAESSREAIDISDATNLLGDGDMLYAPRHQAKPVRVQCADLSETDLNAIISHWENAFAPVLPKLAVDFGAFGASSNQFARNREAEVASPTPPPIGYEPPSAPALNEHDNVEEKPKSILGSIIPPAFISDTPHHEPDAPLELDTADETDDEVKDEDDSGRFNDFFTADEPLANEQDYNPPTETTPHYAEQPDRTDYAEKTHYAENNHNEAFNDFRPSEENWTLPASNVLAPAPVNEFDRAATERVSERIKQSMAQHGVAVEIDQIFHGPAVTMYGLTPGWKRSASGREERVKVSQILGLEKDLALALGTPNIRFEPVVPGETVIGVEVPNEVTTQVNLRSITNTDKWAEFERTAAIPLALGLGNGGVPIFIDLAKMPHLLIAGATGSGKSVCINTLITSALMFRTPEQVRMVLIDPKRVELRQYQDVPHLYSPIVVETAQAIATLKALVQEMDARFDKMSQSGVRNIDDYNRKTAERMPYLFVVIDELADLMMTSANEVERTLARLAQLGRASGIHLAVATQRPSVDVVTGLIKSNFASRISFTVTSIADSRTILDRGGGEKLLGRGDMLMLTSDQLKPTRVQGIFLSDSEIDAVTANWRTQRPNVELPQLEVEAEPDYAEKFGGRSRRNGAADESYLEQAIELAQNRKTLSITHLQTRLMDELEEHGIVGPHEQGKPRQVILNLANTA